MNKRLSEPGLIVSGTAHTALLVAALVAFSSAPKFTDAQESIPVEMVTQSELNEIMKGEKTAKEKKPAPPKAEKVAETPLTKPQPATPEAKTDIPAPPPPLRPAPEPVAETEPPKPPAAKPEPVKAARPLPQPRSEPVKQAEAAPPAPPARPAPPKVEAKLEPKAEDPDDALVVTPKPRPPPKPEPPKEAAAPPEPPKKIRPAEKPKTAETKTAETKAQEPVKLDEVAKLLEKKRLEELSKQAAVKSDAPAPAPPKPAAVQPAPAPARAYDPSSIAKLLNHDKPQQTASAAPEVSRTASIGAPTQSAARMSPSMMAALDGLMMDQYLRCWPDNGMDGRGYVAQIRVQYGPDGSLIGQPALTNPPTDPVQRGLAEDALRAVRKCNPLKIPAQYAPFYEQWRQRLLRMNPEDRTG